MRSRAKPTQAKVDAKPSRSTKASKKQGVTIRDLEKHLAEAVKREAEARDQHTATSAILRMISASPTDARPVFDAIVRSAVRLCDARFANVFRLEGAVVHLVAHHNLPLEALEQFRRTFPQPLSQGGTITAQAMRRRTVIHVHDIELLSDVPVAVRELSRSAGYRSALAVPILLKGSALGAIGVGRSDGTGAPRPFSDTEIDLLTSFADQASIAIENMRLFNELESRNGDLAEALERQTATSEILRVISSFQADIQPVFDAIAAKALDLCRATTGWVYRFDGELIHIAAAHSLRPEAVRVIRESYPMPPSQGGGTARAVLSRHIVYIPDIREDPEYRLETLAQAADYLSVLAVPMLLEGQPIGVVVVTGAEAGAFSERQIEVLQIFADQAVIAVQNVRLFEELKARNRDVSATSEILQVISRSPTDEKPVFDAIAQSSMRLCGAVFAMVASFDGELLHLVSTAHVRTAGVEGLATVYPLRPNRGQIAGRAVLERAVVHVPDVTIDPDYIGAPGVGNRATLSVPILRHGTPIGTITIGRFEPVPFSDQQIGLLKTFADQAVIAIENVRLFKELDARTHDLTRSVDELRALGEVGQAISSTLDLQTVLSTIVARATQLAGRRRGHHLRVRCQARGVRAASHTASRAEYRRSAGDSTSTEG